MAKEYTIIHPKFTKKLFLTSEEDIDLRQFVNLCDGDKYYFYISNHGAAAARFSCCKYYKIVEMSDDTLWVE